MTKLGKTVIAESKFNYDITDMYVLNKIVKNVSQK